MNHLLLLKFYFSYWESADDFLSDLSSSKKWLSQLPFISAKLLLKLVLGSIYDWNRLKVFYIC